MEQTKHNDYETDTDISDGEYQEMTVTPPQHWQEMEKLVGQLQHEFKQVRLEEASLAASCEKYKYRRCLKENFFKFCFDLTRHKSHCSFL